MFVGNHISLRIKVDDSFHHSGLWHISGEYEHAEGASIVWLPDGLRTGGDRTPHGPVESLLTGLHPDELGAIVNLDVRVVLGLLCHHGIAGEVVLTHQQRHLACEAGEEHRLLSCGETASDHNDVLAGEELAITSGAIGDSSTGIFEFTVETDFARAAPWPE